MSRNRNSQAEDLLPSMLVLAGGLAAIACCLYAVGGRLVRWDAAPFPYVWRDVALVYLLSSLPLAALLAVVVRRRLSATGCLGLAGLLLPLSFLLMMGASPGAPAGLLAAALLRAGPAFGFAAGAALIGAAFAPPRPGGGRVAWRPALGLGMLFLLFLPPVYVTARCHNDTARVVGLLEQSRFGEAQPLLRRLLALDPQAVSGQHRLQEVALEVDRIVSELDTRVARPLRPAASDEQRYERARDLAILGRTEAAITVLQSSPDLWESADGCLLQGTVYESAGQWSAARESYRRAALATDAAAASPENTARRAAAAKGIAFCERKLGRYAEAEMAYRELLEMAPSADTHFLLARFYEDAQSTSQARFHARRAMELAPDRYQAEGERLIDKLVTVHFGCLGVFAAERDVSSDGRR